MDRLRAGIIGCGAVAQMMHLPYLHELDDRYEIAALCDIDAGTLDRVADHYDVAARHQTVDDLLSEPLDVAFILTSGDHAPVALAALERGLHVFVEKPLAYTLRETDDILAAAERADRVLMVGMMKQYDPGYRRGVELVRELKDLRFVDARTMHPDNGLYMSHHHILRGGSPRPPGEETFGPAFFEGVQRSIVGDGTNPLLKEGSGSDRPEVQTAFALLTGSSIHDINVLRGALGQPSDVVSAHAWAAGTSFTATLAYPNDVRVNYTWSLLPYLKHYEQDFSFFASDGRVHIRFPSPYLRNEPTLVDVERMRGDELCVTRVLTSYEEAFKIELLEFDACVRAGRAPFTDGPGYRQDQEVICEIARRL
ncbi:MAG: Gfo/Idh/MocA family oxidoreductase [Thermomicrobiales bacterium]|nr:Gfo/Idh/MocA family oxidoreductase [Thermomicrobiales bacterium]